MANSIVVGTKQLPGLAPHNDKSLVFTAGQALYGNAGANNTGATTTAKSPNFTAEFALLVAGQTTPIFDVTYIAPGLKGQSAKVDYFTTDMPLGTLPAGNYRLVEQLNVGKVVPEVPGAVSTSYLDFSVVAPPPTTPSTVPVASATAQATDQLLALAGQSLPSVMRQSSTDSGRQTRLPAGMGMLGAVSNASNWANDRRKPSSATNTTYWLYDFISIGRSVRGISFYHPPFCRGPQHNSYEFFLKNKISGGFVQEIPDARMPIVRPNIVCSFSTLVCFFARRRVR